MLLMMMIGARGGRGRLFVTDSIVLIVVSTHPTPHAHGCCVGAIVIVGMVHVDESIVPRHTLLLLLLLLLVMVMMLLGLQLECIGVR